VAAAHERLAARTGHGAGLRVAVRSSAVAEDATSASFAGQFDTYLGVTGVPDVLHHVCKCWASGLSAHALAYRRRADGSAGHMAGGSAGNMADSPPGVIVRYLCQQAAAIEDAAGGAPQDVEWAIARGQPFPDNVFILQHRPVTTLDNPRPATPPAARDPGPHPATPQPATAPARKPAFDPVQYALRNVFRVPGA
jgi:phosphoenolpyruvate synthase/pyruvate phosphate dikinase